MTTPETGAATPVQDDVCRLADLYCETKDRIVGLLDDSDAAQWNRPVPACPGWSVRDVVAHLTAVALDLLDGRLTVPPSDAETAEHVRRFDGCDEDELFSVWGGAADGFPIPGSKKRLSIRSRPTLKMKILHLSKTPRPTMIRSPRLLPTGSTMTVTTSRNIRPNQTTANQPLPVLLLAKIPN